MRSVRAAHSVAAGRMPRLNAFSANHTPLSPAVSAVWANARHSCGCIPPCSRTLSFGSELIGPPDCRGPAAAGLNAARTRRFFFLGEMGVDHTPHAVVFLAEHHG